MSLHTKDIQDIFKQLHSSPHGLSAEEASKRLGQYGRNELIESKKRTLFMMFLDQFKDFMIMVLIAAAIISGIIGELVDTLAIVVIVILNAIIGFVQEYRAEKAIKALKKMAAPTAVVYRDMKPMTISASQLVPGDVVILEAGSIVPADLRLFETARLTIDEAALTGESVPVEKTSHTLQDESLSLGDRKNLSFKGTTITYGRGKGIVVSTGMDTELGKIATLLQEEEEVKTPLQKRLSKFGQRLGIAVLAICAIVLITGLLRGESPLLMFLTAISLAVAAIPEALPAVVTISLAIGAKKMVRQQSLIRKLPAVETLGSVTYICSDKTGTLTLNRMTVEEMYVEGKLIMAAELKGGKAEVSSELFNAMALSNDAVLDKDSNVIGDPTEVALFEAADRAGVNKKDIEKIVPRVAEIPFDSDRKCMTTFHRMEERSEKQTTTPYVSFTKGAFESILAKSISMLTSDGRIIGIDDTIRKDFIRANENMANDGLRTLAFAMRLWESLPEEIHPESVEDGLILLGITGLMDPPREEAKEAVHLCKTAGIRPVMITGDHPLTARNIAKKLGIMTADDPSHDGGHRILTGKELGKNSKTGWKTSRYMQGLPLNKR
jgi:Ca2+-transporting ATPase